MWSYNHNETYRIDGELYHYGIKGMKWKNHKYIRLASGEYVYDQLNKNLDSLYKPVTQSNIVAKTAVKTKPKTKAKLGSSYTRKYLRSLLSKETSENSKKSGKGSGGGSGGKKGSGGGSGGKKGSGAGKGKKSDGKKGKGKKRRLASNKSYKDISNPKTLTISDRDLVPSNKSSQNEKTSGSIVSKSRKFPIKRKQIGKNFVNRLLVRRAK